MANTAWLIVRVIGVWMFLSALACAPTATPAPAQPTDRAPVGSPTVTNVVTPVVRAVTSPSALPLPSSFVTVIPAARPSVQPSIQPTNQPTSRPSDQPTTRPATQPPTTVRAYEGAVSLSLYPYARFLTWSVDAATGVPFATLDRAEYEATSPKPQAQMFKAVYLENDFLLLTFLPELGGRLYQVVFKPTNQSLFYNNPVIKPSRWGPFESDKNWWLAVGGMEWAVPVQEHGYEWGSAWTYRTQSDGEMASITLRDSDAPNRLQTQVTVTLRRGEAAWSIAPQVSNPTTRPMRVQFWLNALLTLGGRTIAPDTEFTLPTSAVRVHSTGDKRLSDAKETITWPTYQTIDFSRYANWQNWLGVFAKDTTAGWDGAWGNSLGLARIYPATVAQGVKLFAFGPQFPDRSYTDDDSQYFELWGGPNKSFWPEDDVTIAPGAKVGWSETWYPVSGAGGLTYANTRAALNINSFGRNVVVGVAAPTMQRGTLVAISNSRMALKTSVSLSPGYGFATRWAALDSDPSPSHVVLQWLDENNSLVAQTEADVLLR